MKVVFCGTRERPHYSTIFERMERLPPDAIIITGGAEGVDSAASTAASNLRLQQIIVPAAWGRFGRRAGPVRNRLMLDLGPDLVVAIHPDLDRSKGTKDCVAEARRRGIKVEVIVP